MLKESRKRGRSSYSPGPEITLTSIQKEPQLIKTLEPPIVVNHIKQLGKEYKTQLSQNVYLTIEVGVPESRYFEQNLEEVLATVKEHFSLTDFSISDMVPGCIERYITLNGDLVSVVKSALYVCYVTCVVLNNQFHNVNYTLKTPNYKLTILDPDELTSERLRQIEQKAKFSSLTYYDVCKPNYYSLKGTVLKLELVGSFKSLFDFLHFIIESSQFKFSHLDEGKINQVPIIFADDGKMYQTQEFNTPVMEHTNEFLSRMA